jgi:hypothetical protein
MVVCAASAFAALGVPPFWIWHDAVFLYSPAEKQEDCLLYFKKSSNNRL